MLKFRKVLPLVFWIASVSIYAQSISEDVVAESSLEAQLTTAELPADQIQFFHERAKQKLDDFAETLSLISDEELEKELRMQVAETALDYFWSNQTSIEWFDLNSGQIINVPLDDFLEKTREEERSITFQVIEKNGNPPAFCPPPICKWEIKFELLQQLSSGDTYSNLASMEVVMEKKKKAFGTLEKEVWSVFLGEIKIFPSRP